MVVKKLNLVLTFSFSFSIGHVYNFIRDLQKMSYYQTQYNTRNNLLKPVVCLVTRIIKDIIFWELRTDVQVRNNLFDH